MTDGQGSSLSLPLVPNMRFYTGGGSSKAPPDIYALLMLAAQHLAALGMILRTGANKGAEEAFVRGAGVQAEIFVSHTGAGGHRSGIVVTDTATIRQAAQIAASVHPEWRNYNDFARKAHTRSIYQVLGADLQTPSAYIICWAPADGDGQVEGTVRTVLAVAKLCRIPIYNLAELAMRTRFRKRLDELELPQPNRSGTGPSGR